MAFEKVTIGPHTLYRGDCLEVIPTLGKVDAVITSPPYGQQRDYGERIKDWRSLVSGAMTSIADSGTTQVLVNLGLTHNEGRVTRYWDGLIEDMELHGWRLFGWYVWDQGDGLPGDWHGRLAPSHEFVFHFNRSQRKLNKWVPTKSFGRSITGTGLRKANGTTAERMSHDGKKIQPFKISDSVLRVYREMRRNIDHPAIYPIDLPISLAKSFTSDGECILDPFLGSGTTLIACNRLGRVGIGIEKETKYFDLACQRLEAEIKQASLLEEVA